MLNKIENNNINFKQVRFLKIGPRAKERNLFKEVIEQNLKAPVDSLDKKV